MRRITEVDGLAPAVGPYSYAIVTGNTVYTAGQVGQTAEGKLVESGIEAQAHQTMDNLGKILRASAVDFNRVVKTTIYLTDKGDFTKVNEVYATYFAEGEYPVRETTIVTSLLLDAKIEISMVAVVADNS